MIQVDFSKALSEVLELLKTNVPTLLGLEKVCAILKKNFQHYHWVGFYFADFKKQTLNLKAFSGNPVEHTEIPFGKGICGQVAVSNENLVGNAKIIFFSNDTISGSIMKFWNWNKSLRVERFFYLLK